ncbi:hypothetical protein POPTR_012G061333v4 [Populus trichocarpa]|uniref:Uncharacterized protein n=1 Tax=Populus trichocarpa TaxID=3694 RepID=A0ACC0S4E9_POPTR|nr:hypothetical protein POPTR_012G061333v4 [Populus trichocarpa]
MLTSEFEEMRMLEDESFDEFYAKINGIVNSKFNLGDKVGDVTAIEESNVLNTIHVEELVGSLQTYESTFLYQKKGKSITLKSSREKHDYSSNNDINNEDIALIAKKFRKFKLKKKKTNKGKKVNDFVKRNESENESKIKIESKEKVKCFECSGYDHLRSECLNFKRNKGKALNVTLSDESDSKNSNSSSDNKFAFVAFSDTEDYENLREEVVKVQK